jgi:hypothetical protein
MSLTAADYFRRLFDFYPVAYDESPLLYRILNKARQDVADNFCLVNNTTFSIGSSLNLYASRVWRVFYIVPSKGYIKQLPQYGYYNELRAHEPEGYIYNYAYRILSIVPQTWNNQNGEYFDILYTPILSQMNSLSDEEIFIPDVFRDCVALRMAYMLAINDMQHNLAMFFDNQWRLELARSVRARG